MTGASLRRVDPRRSLALGLALAIISACSSPFSPEEARTLHASRAQWAGRSFPDYTFTAQRECFCSAEDLGPVRITVRQGVITDATLLDTGQSVPASNWFTIDQLFQLIPTFGEEDEVDDVVVAYDATLGYPASVEVRFPEEVLDAGIRYTVTDVGPAT